jgi:hypothetical protein
MNTRLINVRLDEERVRKVQVLRQEGVALSDLVREAIDAKYEALTAGEQQYDAEKLIERLFATYPDPAELPPRGYDVHDGRAAREAIRRRLSERRE